MKYDILVAGVGGQGVLSASVLIGISALEQGLKVKQSETHGMAQRGGAVVANLRLSDEPVHSGLIPKAGAAMILSLEPLESLRYIDYLSPRGLLVTSTEPVRNIEAYPDLEELLDRIQRLPRTRMVDTRQLTRQLGSARCSNVAMVGAASHNLPVPPQSLEEAIGEMFQRKGEKVVALNLEAFRAGRAAFSPN